MFIVVSIIILEVCQCKNKYPNWFFSPKEYPDLFIGYSMTGTVDAKDDAIWRASFLNHGFIKGKASYFNDEDKWEKKYHIEALAPIWKKEKLTEVSTFLTSFYRGGEEITLFKEKDTHFNTNSISFDFPSTTAPDWTSNGSAFYSDGYLYGVGRYVLRGDENDAWRTAEERALVQMIYATQIEIESQLNTRRLFIEKSKKVIQEENIRIITYTFNHEFSDIQILERWVDYRDKEFDEAITAYIYVLMRTDVNKIKLKQ
jgi:hypothetical protein